ncbi:M23 family metallopeptidase [Streptomyces sp. TS71-3]|uniref:M23 family metallopeptidase n=1 Tax=Streptomyces sp. TS71-3 TaxID=2733862 RepID=UPI001B1739DD|nr:M23 family metallopeptidase [Streptomyces sp. TS71-3]GHJ35059.1 peptidase [Streptomyces sp. TS71-3]
MNDRHPSGDPYPPAPAPDADYASYPSYDQQGVQYGGQTGYDGYSTYAAGGTATATAPYATDGYDTGHYATGAYTSGGFAADGFATGSFTPGAFAAGNFESDPLFGDLPGAEGGTASSDATGSYPTGQWDAAAQDPYGYAAQQHQQQGTDFGTAGYDGYGSTGYDTSGQWDATAWNGGGEWEAHSYAQQAPAAQQDPLFGAEYADPHQYDPYASQNLAPQDTGTHGYDSPDAAHQGYQAGGVSPAESAGGYEAHPYQDHAAAHPDPGMEYATDPSAYAEGLEAPYGDGSEGHYGDGYAYDGAPAADGAYGEAPGTGHEDPAYDGAGDAYDNPGYDDPAGAHDPADTDHYRDADHYGDADSYSDADRYGDDDPYADGDGDGDDTADDAATAALPEEAPGGDLPRQRSGATPVRPGSRGAASRARARRRPAKRSALLTVVVPSACVIGVAGVAAAAVGGGGDDNKDVAASGTPVKPSVANNKLDTQLENLSVDAGDFADRASRTQERIDLKAKQEEARKKAAAEAARKEALRPKFVLPVTQKGLSAYFGQSGENWMSLHTGIDFPVAYGTQVMSAIDGTVTTKYNVAYGNMAIVTAKDGTQTWYCHLSSYKVSPGTTVKAGDVIAFSGNSGNSTGPHLHFEVHPGGGAAVDPLPWLRSHGLDPT